MNWEPVKYFSIEHVDRDDDEAVRKRSNASKDLMNKRRELKTLRKELAAECGCHKVAETKVSDVQAYSR